MTHGLFTGGPMKILEDCGHIGMALLPIDTLLWIREWTQADLSWPFKGQWPPGNPYKDMSAQREHGKEVTQLDRVSDVGRDELGYTIGRELRVWVLIALLIWRW